MATKYLRKNRWWVAWGWPRRQKATPYTIEQEAEAERLKHKVERDYRRELELERSMLVPGKAFKTYRQNWVAARKEAGVASAHDDEVRLKHVHRDLDGVHMQDIKPRHLEDAIKRLKREKKLSDRSIRHIGGVLSVLFRDAYAEEAIPSNLMPFRRGILPPLRDKKHGWRATAIYTREEIELLISSPLVPDDRRVLYALMFLTGERVGEVSARTWKDWDSGREPLGCLYVHSSFNTKQRKTKRTKTEVEREVPVHPVLARALTTWRASGWAQMMGRKPALEDLIIPHPTRGHRTASVVWKRLQEDLRNLSLRTRRAHDTRRAFVSLALADGAVEHVLERITHGPRGNIMSLYNTVPWPTLCDAVNHLKIRADVFRYTIATRASESENS